MRTFGEFPSVELAGFEFYRDDVAEGFVKEFYWDSQSAHGGRLGIETLLPNECKHGCHKGKSRPRLVTGPSRSKQIHYSPPLCSGGPSPPIMSTSQILQSLHTLGTSSPDISRLIGGLIQRDEEEQYLSSLGGSELVQLVDGLDRVCPLPFRILSGYGMELAGPQHDSCYGRHLPAMPT